MKSITKKSLIKVFGTLLDAVILATLIMSVTVAGIITVQRVGNGFAGYGTVQSESMSASGLNVGDIVKVNQKDEYSLGDIIVFYRAPEYYGEAYDMQTVKSHPIWIHEVIDIRTDSLGRTTYLTKGSSNPTDDGAYVPQDFVLGKAKRLTNTTIAVLRYLCSIKGIVLFVEIPCGLVLVYLIWDLVIFLKNDKTIHPQNKIDLGETK